MKVKQATPPRVHHCAELAEQVGAPEHLIEAGAMLESKYMAARYPDAAKGIPFKQFQDGDSELFLKAAGDIRQWVLQQLNSPI